MNMFSSKEKGGKEDTNPDDIPREDLLNLCMKLNKRMKSLEIKGQELSQKYKTILGQRNNLMELIAVTTDIPIDEEDDGSIDHIKDILLHHLNSDKIKNKDLNNKINILEEKLDAQERGQTPNDFQQPEGNAGDLKNRNEKLKNKVYSLEMDMQEKHTKIAYLEKKVALSSVQESKERHLQGLEATIEEQKRVISVQSSELDKLRQYVVAAERKASAGSLLKAEQEALLFSLRKDLKAALQCKEDNDKKIRELMEYRIRTEGKLGNLLESKEKLSQSEADLDEAHSLIKRLENRLHLAESNLALRTASMASTEEQIESLQLDLESKDKDLQEAAKTSQCLKQQMSDVEGKLSGERIKHCDEMNAKQVELDDAIRLHEEKMTSSQNAFGVSIDEMKKDASKKSQTARQLLDEKVSAIRKLTEDNISLREEVESGHPADRKIFEMASRQATRESNLRASRDARELAFQQLQSSLAAKDLDLARLQDSHRRVTSEVEELRKVKNRETVNMDYLKNIVLQYMSFPSSSPERAGLVPVISLLLQFNKEEAMLASSGVDKESVLWSSRPVKELKIHPSKNLLKNSTNIVSNTCIEDSSEQIPAVHDSSPDV